MPLGRRLRSQKVQPTTLLRYSLRIESAENWFIIHQIKHSTHVDVDQPWATTLHPSDQTRTKTRQTCGAMADMTRPWPPQALAIRLESEADALRRLKLSQTWHEPQQLAVGRPLPDCCGCAQARPNSSRYSCCRCWHLTCESCDSPLEIFNDYDDSVFVQHVCTHCRPDPERQCHSSG